MTEMIVRISSEHKDVEIAVKNDFDAPVFKKIEKKEFVRIVDNDFKSNEFNVKKDLFILDSEIIAMDYHHVVINQPERKRIVTYNDNGKILTYRISFPNSIYIMCFNDSSRINNIECYAYKEYKGEETELFEYPMPNELAGSNICIGNVDRTITDRKYVDALERVIFTPYSHSTFSGMNGFSQTKVYFEYLEKNDFPYRMMKPLKKKLKDVLHD